MTITGTNFIDATAVTFGGTNAASFTVDNDGQITAIVGSGATGLVSVTTPGGTASSATNFNYLGYITTSNSTWTNPATWLGGAVPPAGATVTLAHNVTVVNPLTNTGTITVNPSVFLILANTLTNSGTLTINGNLQVNDNIGVITGNSPVYGASSGLACFGSIARTTSNAEFPALNGPGI